MCVACIALIMVCIDQKEVRTADSIVDDLNKMDKISVIDGNILPRES